MKKNTPDGEKSRDESDYDSESLLRHSKATAKKRTAHALKSMRSISKNGFQQKNK